MPVANQRKLGSERRLTHRLARARCAQAHYFESAPELKKYLVAKKLAAAKARASMNRDRNGSGGSGDINDQLTTWPADFGRGGGDGGEAGCFFPCAIL